MVWAVGEGFHGTRKALQGHSCQESKQTLRGLNIKLQVVPGVPFPSRLWTLNVSCDRGLPTYALSLLLPTGLSAHVHPSELLPPGTPSLAALFFHALSHAASSRKSS